MKKSDRTTAACAAALLLATPAWAANPQYPQYPQTTPYPQQPAPGAVYRAPRMRDMFAATLATVLQTTGQTAMMSVSQGLSGAINNWFVRKTGGQPMGMPMPIPTYTNSLQPASAPAPEYPQYPSANDPNAVPAPQDNSAYPSFPSAGDPGAQPSGGAAAYPSFPDTGSTATADPGAMSPPGTYPATPAAPPTTQPTPIYAGVAYEVHLLGANGMTSRVDPATQIFHTGDRFRVFYRPALPGRVDVFNINAAGQNTQIDTVQVAAGELASLGPYEFSDLTGRETLILRLSPCSSPALVAATRNIVKVQDPSTAAPAISFGSCTSTRGIKTKTRDIRKVAVEDGTSFALDQVSAQEMNSGQLASRQVTITLQHQ
jgi:hypothetical protein